MFTEDLDISFKDLFIDSLNEPMIGLDKDLNIALWNSAAAKIAGLNRDSLIGKAFNEICDVSNTDVLPRLAKRDTVSCTAVINRKTFKVYLSPIVKAGDFSGYRGVIYKLDIGVLKEIPSEYLIEVINASPISSIVFNMNGTILYSNNAYKKLWNLSDEDLEFVNHKYNLFLDRQLEGQGLMPIIEDAFKGAVRHSPVFNYFFNSKTLGREGNASPNQLIAHMYPIHDVSGEVIYIVLNFMDVTEQHELQEAYRISEERLQFALEGANLGTWDWFVDTNKMVYNERWASMLGYTLDEVHEIKWTGLLHPEDKKRCLDLMKEFASGKNVKYEAEYRLRTKSGKYKWILDRGKIVEWAKDGHPLRGAGTHIDIDERKRNEEKVQKSEVKYRRLVENAPIGIAIVVDEKIKYINKTLAVMGEVDDFSEIENSPVKKFLIGEERYAKFKEREKLVIKENQNAPLYSTQFQTAKGNVIDVEIVSIPVEYQGKQAMQVLIHDVSDRKTALHELSRSRELLNQLFENSPMGIVLLDHGFKVQNVNKGFEKMFGYAKEAIVKKSMIELIVPDELKSEAYRLSEAASNGKIDYVESYRYDKFGNRKHLLIYVLPVTEAGKQIGIYGIYIDIGQRILAEEELKTRNLELDNFVYKVSHDLRAPLASILGLINLTKLESDESDMAYYVDLMESQVNKLDHFIRDILSHSKNLKMSVSADEVDFESIVNKCFDDLGYMKASASIIRKITVSSKKFISDKWRISEIFRNLIGNAIKYHNPELNENIVEVSVDVTDNGCEIEVVDNGIGISEDKLPHVMDMFYRGTESSDGSGIGLYIVQKAVEKLKGRLDIKSEVGKGTRFRIWLPILKQMDSPG